MKPGDTVTIYEDPMTQRVPEGEAKLIKKISTSMGGERWIVRFDDGDYERFIFLQEAGQ
ncbi:hypothetical protein LCGC14_0259250 [marine sediment metagenome]|uniref:DUF1918 domain-containing protein n=1 Tax=marine sediment metagenome TaxID=412755 RepID=A0A0F9U2J6_9ZZZZ